MPNENDVYDLSDPDAILEVDSIDPAIARRQVQRWSEIDPVYGGIASQIRNMLKQRDERRKAASGQPRQPA